MVFLAGTALSASARGSYPRGLAEQIGSLAVGLFAGVLPPCPWHHSELSRVD
jgi:hypothetical protein